MEDFLKGKKEVKADEFVDKVDEGIEKVETVSVLIEKIKKTKETYDKFNGEKELEKPEEAG